MTPETRHCELKKTRHCEAQRSNPEINFFCRPECGFYSIKSSSINVIELICSEEYSP